MSINCDLDEGETQNSVLIICETWHVWRWDTNVVTQAEVEMYMDEGEIGIFGPGWKWARTWMEMRQEFGDLEAGEAGHGWRWSTHPETRMTQVVTHLNPGLYICVPSSSRWLLSSNQVTKIASLFHPGNISNQHKSQDVRLTSLQVLRVLYHLHLCTINVPIFVLLATYVCITSIPVLKTACQFHPGITLNQSNLLHLCLISIQVLYHQKTDSKILVSPSSRWRLNSIQIVITISQLHSDLISNPYRSRDVHLTSIHVLPHLHPARIIIVSPPSIQSFTSIQYNIFASHPQPGPNFCNSPPPSPPFT